MTACYLTYPRLANEHARERLVEIRDAFGHGVGAVKDLASVAHPKAAPIATGGRAVRPEELRDIRERVTASVERWISVGEIARSDQPEFDALLGQALHEALMILPADAAHPSTWNFLSTVLLPDVVITRFNDIPDNRGLGTNRNVLRRAWHRWDILGDLLVEGSPTLREDELVGLLERTAVARNRPLVRELARAVLAYQGRRARTEYARDLYKMVRRRTGPLMLDVLTDAELAALVDNEVQRLT